MFRSRDIRHTKFEKGVFLFNTLYLSYRTTLHVVSLSIIMLHDITLLMYIICPSVLCHHICCVWVRANDDVMMMMSCHHVKPTLYLQLPMIRRVQDRTCIAKLELWYLNKIVNTHYTSSLIMLYLDLSSKPIVNIWPCNDITKIRGNLLF